jgi:hypothetical protein
LTKLIASSIKAIEQIVGAIIISIIVFMSCLTISSLHDSPTVVGNMHIKISTRTELGIFVRSCGKADTESRARIKSWLRKTIKPCEKKKPLQIVGSSTGQHKSSAREEWAMQLKCLAGLTKLIASSIIAIEQIVGAIIISIIVFMRCLTISSLGDSLVVE